MTMPILISTTVYQGYAYIQSSSSGNDCSCSWLSAPPLSKNVLIAVQYLELGWPVDIQLRPKAMEVNIGAMEAFPGTMVAHLGAEEAQHGAQKLESHVGSVVHPGAWIPFLEPWQLILEQRRLNMEPGSSKAM
jgi:hypothetical protein